MKARKYFAVVTGTNNPDDSIADIRKAEREFFNNSNLFLTGVLKANSMGTDSLARAVSATFWELLHKSMKEEASLVSAALKQKESEWSIRFPGQRRMTRHELFSAARHEMLEACSKFQHGLTTPDVERALAAKIWDQIRPFVMNTLYMGACSELSPDRFQTNVEGLLGAWVHATLPKLTIEVAHEVLMDEVNEVINFPDPDGIFKGLKDKVYSDCKARLGLGPRSEVRLRSVQELKMRDDAIPDAVAWRNATQFMEQKIETEHAAAIVTLNEEMGPSALWQWLLWKRVSPTQNARAATIAELSGKFNTPERAAPSLSIEEATVAAQTINRGGGMKVNTDFVHETYLLPFLFIDHSRIHVSLLHYCRNTILAAR